MTTQSVRRRFLWLVWLRWLPVGVIMPLLVLVLLDHGLSLTDVGVVMAVYGITTAVLELPTGGLADTVGRRPVLFVSALLGMGFVFMLLMLHGIVGLSLAAFVGGLGRALGSGPLEAWFVDATRAADPHAGLERGLSLAGAVDGAALALGAVAGGFLPQVFQGRLAAPLVAALALQGLHAAAVAFLMTESAPDRPGTAAGAGRHPLAEAFSAVPRVVRAGTALTVRYPHLRRLMLGCAALGVGISAIEVLWQPRFAALLGRAAGRTGFFGVLLAAAFGAAALGSFVAPRLRRCLRGRVSRVITAAQVLMGVAVLALAAAGDLVVASVAFAAVYLCNGLLGPHLQEVLHEHVPADCRSTMVSVSSLSLQGGNFASALTLPALAAVHGIPTAWMVAGAILTAASLLYSRVPNRAADRSEVWRNGPADCTALGSAMEPGRERGVSN